MSDTKRATRRPLLGPLLLIGILVSLLAGIWFWSSALLRDALPAAILTGLSALAALTLILRNR